MERRLLSNVMRHVASESNIQEDNKPLQKSDMIEREPRVAGKDLKEMLHPKMLAHSPEPLNKLNNDWLTIISPQGWHLKSTKSTKRPYGCTRTGCTRTDEKFHGMA